MNLKPLFWIILLFTSTSFNFKPRQVLFIGNSLTYYYKIPQILQNILNEKNIEMTVHQMTKPGVSLSMHLNDRATLEKLNSQEWDYVILQEATVRILIPEVAKYSAEPSMIKFDSIIKAKHGKTIFYQAYSISQYPNTYCYPSSGITDVVPERKYCSPLLESSYQEFNIIKKFYSKLAEKTNAEIAPVGASFELCKRKYPDLMLFDGLLDSHPSPAGSYLLACVFFRKVSGEKIGKLAYTGGLSLKDAEKIWTIADSF